MRTFQSIAMKMLAASTAIFLLSNAHAQQHKLPLTDKAKQLLTAQQPATGLNAAAVQDYIVTNAYVDKITGDLLVYLQQTHQQIPVYNKIGVYIFRRDTLISHRADFVSKLPFSAVRQASPSIGAEQAIQRAGMHFGIRVPQQWKVVEKNDVRQRFAYDAKGYAQHPMTSELVWVPNKEGNGLTLSWSVQLGTADGNQEWMAHIDAQTGEVLQQYNLIVSEQAPHRDDCTDVPAANHSTAQEISLNAAQNTIQNIAPNAVQNIPPAINYHPQSGGQFVSSLFAPPPPPAVTSVQYRVYAYPMESASYGNRSLVNNPWLMAGTGNNATTLGWHYDNTNDYTYTRGNNVWAREDLSGARNTSGYADTSVTALPTLTFDRALDTAGNPMDYYNSRASINNMFYWSNLVHDITYQYGFDEAAGNFQAHNLNRGGQDNDYLHAFSMDGGGVNNADFFAPADGQNPRMRMFLWNYAVAPKCQITGSYAATPQVAESTVSSRNRLLNTGAKTAEVVLVLDLSGGTNRACGAISNTSALVGKIALIDRGGTNCSFAQKIKNCQNAGAIGVIVANNAAGVPFVMTGDDSTIVIPAVMITQADGITLKNNLPGAIATLSATGHYMDGALDNGIIAHEYMHGITNRLTAGPANASCLFNAEQMGEGWSDYLALMLTTNWSTAAVTDGTKRRPLANYVLLQPTTGGGLRKYPYSTDMSINPLTYSDVALTSGGETHNIGEVWCATLWDMTWNIIAMEGIDGDLYHGNKGNNIAMQLVMQGLKYQPCGPGFIDGRDAILKADSLLYNYAHKCAIWNAFARRGMGKGATQGNTNNYQDQTTAFDLPNKISLSHTANKTAVANGDGITITLKASCECQALSNISIADTLSPNLTYVSSTGGTFSSNYVQFNSLNFAAGETKTLTIQATARGAYADPDTLLKDTRDPAGHTWTPSFSGSYNWTESTAKAHSPTKSWFAYNAATTGQQMLTSGNLLLDTLSTLSFWHYYDTEASYDGGIVEITTDGGVNWKDLGPYMTQNGYNSNIPLTVSTGQKAFSGTSGGQFLQTVIPLTGFAGKTVKIRFRFFTDNAVGADGWYIDDIVLTKQKAMVSVANLFSGSTLLSSATNIATFAAASLPVNFLLFEARAKAQTAVLHWKVNGEINVDHYIVERSSDGTTFTALGKVAQQASGTPEKDYYFTDNQPLSGHNYYRIVEKDVDGTPTYSAIRLVNLQSNAFTVKVSPVPAYNQQVKLEIGTSSNAAITATLVNTLGQALQTYRVQPGINWLNLSAFGKGIYFVKIKTDLHATEIRKIVLE